MRKVCLMPDGNYELTNGGDVIVVPAENYEATAAVFFAPRDEAELDAAREIKKAAVADQMAAAFQRGFVVPSGPMQGVVLQVRSQEDRTNWLTSQATYSTAVMIGQGDVEEADFRDTSNVTHTVTFREGLRVLLEMAEWGKNVMKRSWSLKDAIAAAPDFETLSAIDVTAGWP